MIWAFDLATRCTGWCAGTGERRPAFGAFFYPQVGSDLGALAAAFERDLNVLLDRFGTPTHIVYESPILLPSDKLINLRKIYGLGYGTERWAARRKIPVSEISAKAIKKRITGNHTASKDEMVDMIVRRLGFQLPSGPERKDIADAIGCWLAGGVDYHAKQFQPQWDAMLYGSKGALI